MFSTENPLTPAAAANAAAALSTALLEMRRR
jgi:hypothetical protein